MTEKQIPVEMIQESLKTPQQILDILDKIAKGEITVTPQEDPAHHFCGDLEYSCSNGYKLLVFNDCAEWDYLDEMRDEKGELVFYFTFENDNECPEEARKFMGKEWDIIRDYRPKPQDEHLWGF